MKIFTIQVEYLLRGAKRTATTPKNWDYTVSKRLTHLMTIYFWWEETVEFAKLKILLKTTNRVVSCHLSNVIARF